MHISSKANSNPEDVSRTRWSSEDILSKYIPLLVRCEVMHDGPFSAGYF